MNERGKTVRFNFEITGSKLDPKYWEGLTILDGGAISEYPDYDKSTIRSARHAIANGTLDGLNIPIGESLAVFQEGTSFNASNYPIGTLLRIEQDSLLGPFSEDNVAVFNRTLWAATCTSKDKNPRLSKIIIGFFESGNMDYKPQRKISLELPGVPFPGEFRIGQVWRDHLVKNEQTEELRKVLKLEVFSPANTHKKPVRRGFWELRKRNINLDPLIQPN